MRISRARHGKRLRQLLEQLSSRVGSSTPWACQDWANTKAAYRFFGNDRVSEGNILAGHLLLHESGSWRQAILRFLSFTTRQSFLIAMKTHIDRNPEQDTSAGHKGRAGLYTSCGIRMHSSSVIIRDGLPLGLAAIKFWNRDKFHGANAPLAQNQSDPSAH